ncbi:MAG: hypothetical protein Tsb006_5030 [Rickettsiaceae bacterium]
MKMRVTAVVKLMLLILSINSVCYGAEALKSGTRISANISKNGINRIIASPYQIKEIVGDTRHC